jgi:hypothetical protein
MKKSYTDHQQCVHHLNGRKLGYELRGKTAAQRAALAPEYTADGYAIVPYCLTEKQLAALFRVSVATLEAAKALSKEERGWVFYKLQPLVSPTRKLEHTIRTAGVEQSFKVLERVMDRNGASAG